MKKINLGITGCMGRMGQQLIKSSKKDIRSKLVHKNFSWENIAKKLKKEFENKLSK